MEKLIPYFPITAAVLYGLAYALYPLMLRQMPFVTYMLTSSFVAFCIWLTIALTTDQAALKAAVTLNLKQIGFMVGFGLIGLTAWAMTLYASGHINPTYAAIGEVAYVLFVPIFSWLIFRDNQLNTYTVIAGAFILFGVAILLYGKLQQPKNNPQLVADNTHVIEVDNARL